MPLLAVSLVLVFVVFMTGMALVLAGNDDPGPMALVVLPAMVIGGAIGYLWQPVLWIGAVLLFDDLRARSVGQTSATAIAQPAKQQESAETTPSILTAAPPTCEVPAATKRA